MSDDAPGPVEQRVIDECRAHNRPDLTGLAVALARVLDDPNRISDHPSASRQLDGVMGHLKKTEHLKNATETGGIQFTPGLHGIPGGPIGPPVAPVRPEMLPSMPPELLEWGQAIREALEAIASRLGELIQVCEGRKANANGDRINDQETPAHPGGPGLSPQAVDATQEHSRSGG